MIEEPEGGFYKEYRSISPENEEHYQELMRRHRQRYGKCMFGPTLNGQPVFDEDF